MRSRASGVAPLEGIGKESLFFHSRKDTPFSPNPSPANSKLRRSNHRYASRIFDLSPVP
jgi:hypothetical protein